LSAAAQLPRNDVQSQNCFSPTSEVNVLDTRRCFIKSLAGVSGSFLLLQVPAPKSRRPFHVDPPIPADAKSTPPDESRNIKSAQLQAQEKQFRETLANLNAKVADLKEQLDAVHPAQVFSVAIFKQTQEIEKLAKHLKNYAKP
jgi:hypothetical protein